MILGVPVVAGVAGGIGSMITQQEGWLFSGYSGEGKGQGERISKALAEGVLEVFDLGEQVGERTKRAVAHARRTHDGPGNMRQLFALYEELTEA